MQADRSNAFCNHRNAQLDAVPADTPTGAAEVTVLTNVVQPAGTGYGLLQYLENRHWKPVHRRTGADIDQQIRVEREAWE